MSTNLALASIKATGGTTSRTFGTRFAQVVNVKDYGALGNGSTDDTTAIQAAFTAAQSTQYATRPIYFPHGRYMVTGITVTSLSGTYIFGDGVNSTSITSSVSGNTAFKTNGASYNHFQDITFSTSGTGSIGFDLDWDNLGAVSLNANVFVNCAFSGEIGISIGTTGYMGSENLFLGCTWGSCSAQGLVTRNANALDQVIIGGSASSCGTAFKVLTGSIQSIVNVGLAQNTIDIDVQSNCVNSIIGCRTESANFINAAAGTFSIVSCTQDTSTAGTFINNLTGSCVLTACQSYVGKIKGFHGNLSLIACDFDRLSSSITGAANNGSGLIRIQTANAGADAYATGDRVTIASVGGVTAANGTWTITAVDSTHFDLQGSTFSSSYTSGGTIVPALNSYLNSFSGGVSITPYNRNYRLTSTANYTIKRGFSGSQFDNIGASGEVDFTLPDMQDTDPSVTGTKFSFYVGAAQTLKIIATGGLKIRNAASQSSANGSASCATVGNYTDIEYNGTEWFTKAIIGTWTLA